MRGIIQAGLLRQIDAYGRQRVTIVEPAHRGRRLGVIVKSANHNYVPSGRGRFADHDMFVRANRPGGYTGAKVDDRGVENHPIDDSDVGRVSTRMGHVR